MVAGWVFVRVSGWLAVVCRVVRGDSGWILVDPVVVGDGFRRMFILNLEYNNNKIINKNITQKQ